MFHDKDNSEILHSADNKHKPEERKSLIPRDYLKIDDTPKNIERIIRNLKANSREMIDFVQKDMDKMTSEARELTEEQYFLPEILDLIIKDISERLKETVE